jgi:hypothetical protein
MARYVRLTEMASTTAKIISDAVSQWHPAGNYQKSSTFEATAASTKSERGGSGLEAADPTRRTSVST